MKQIAVTRLMFIFQFGTQFGPIVISFYLRLQTNVFHVSIVLYLGEKIIEMCYLNCRQTSKMQNNAIWLEETKKNNILQS